MKATKQDIMELIIKPLSVSFLPLHNPEREPIKYGEMVDVLVNDIFERQYSVNALQYGMKALRIGWEYTRWPTTAQIITYLAKGQEQAGDALEKPKPQTETPRRWADHIMRTPNGQRAIEDGHGLSLYEWAESNPGRTPNGSDMAEVVEITQQQARNMELLRGSGNSIDQGALKIGEGIEKRRVRVEVYYGKPVRELAQ